VLDLLGRFQQLGDSAESLVVEQKPEGVQAELAIANVFMAVDARPEGFLRVVQMKEANVPSSDVAFERIDAVLVRVACTKVVAGCEDVACVEADANAVAVIQRFHDLAELLE
jgi:hypothetical protein